jgi:Acetyltransferase (GNAT) domain
VRATEQSRWPDALGPVTTRPLTCKDLPLLHRWLSTPHVRDWWRGEPATPTDIARKYGPRIDGVVPTRMFIIELRGEAVGPDPVLPARRPPRLGSRCGHQCSSRHRLPHR